MKTNNKYSMFVSTKLAQKKEAQAKSKTQLRVALRLIDAKLMVMVAAGEAFTPKHTATVARRKVIQETLRA